MRDVTDEEFRQLGLSKKWRMVKYATTVEIRSDDDFESFTGVPLALMRQLEEVFETDKISVRTAFEADYSELTPGAGPSIWIEISK